MLAKCSAHYNRAGSVQSLTGLRLPDLNDMACRCTTRYSSPYAIEKVYRELRPALFQGRVIALPRSIAR